MANGEWLTQLLSGLGGAFTGEVAARSRIAEEQEAQRKRDEAERLREQERSLSELRKGLIKSFSPEAARAAAAAGLPLSEVSGIAKLYEPPKTEPKITERRENGGIAIYEDGNFKSWKIRPPSEREGPSALQLANVARGDVRAARSELRGAEALYGSTMARAPKQSQFLTPLDEPDTLQYRLARESWRPESIYAAQRRAGAQQDVEEAEQEFRRVTGQAAPAGATMAGAGAPVRASAALQQQVANDLRDKIAQIIRAPELSPEQKQAMIRQANEQAAAFLRQ